MAVLTFASSICLGRPATLFLKRGPGLFEKALLIKLVLFGENVVGPHPTVLLLHGFPGNEKNLDLA
jgi:hypothetical protein